MADVDLVQETMRPQKTKAQRETFAVRAAIGLSVLICLVPILTIRFPPMTDYANHYVRLWLLTGGIKQADLASIYEIDWNVSWMNLGIDLIAITLGHALPMTAIGPIILALGLLLPPLGVALLNRKVFGQAHWWQVLCLALAWNGVFLFGFLNYSISLGLALMFASLEDKITRKSHLPAFAIRCGLAEITLLAHPFGLLFYTVLLAGLRFGNNLSPLRNRRSFFAAIGRITFAVAPTFVPVIICLLFGPALPGDKSISLFQSMHWNRTSFADKISMLFTYFQTYNMLLDSIFITLFGTLVLVSIKDRTLRVHFGLGIAAFLLFLLSCVMPSEMMMTGGIDNRFPCMMTLALAAGIQPATKGARRTQRIMIALSAIAVISRAGIIETIWLNRSSDVAAVERVLRNVPAGSSILPIQHVITLANVQKAPLGRVVAQSYDSYWHYPALAIIERHAFMPYLFVAQGKQPVNVLPPWDEISLADGQPIPVNLLHENGITGAKMMHDWQHRFDYVLVLNADMPNPDGPMPSFPFLKLVEDSGFAQLWKIDHS